MTYASSNVLWRGVSVTGEFLCAPESLNDTAWAFSRFLFLQKPEVLHEKWKRKQIYYLSQTRDLGGQVLAGTRGGGWKPPSRRSFLVEKVASSRNRGRGRHDFVVCRGGGLTGVWTS